MPIKLMKITGTCWRCQAEQDVIVPQKGFDQWQNGANVQDAFPHLSPDNREFLISQTCGCCFDDLFGDDDE